MPPRTGIELPAAYNRYLRADGNEMYEEENEDYEILLWPLYFTSFLIDDFLDDEDMFGAMLGDALERLEPHLLRARPPAAPAGRHRGGRPDLTAECRVHRVARRLRPCACLTRRLDSLDAQAAVYVDMSGDAKVRERRPRPLRRRAQALAAVGITHREDLGGGSRARRPEPRLLLRSRLASRSAPRTGGARASTSVWPTPGAQYVDWARGWLRVEHGSGPEDIERIYREMLDGKSDPAVGHVLSPGD